MRRYIEHIRDTRDPHQRRMHALRLSGSVTAVVFALWLGTLGVRLAGPDTVATEDGTVTPVQNDTLQAAAAASKNNKGAYLEVSTTSVYSN
jgi:hypothetical protein